MTYAQLSGYKRDVLAAVLTTPHPTASGAIKQRTAEIRQQPPSPYVYQLLEELVAEGWLTCRTAPHDERVNHYQLTDTARTALGNRFDLLADGVCASVDQSPPDPPLRSDGGQPTDTLQATLSVLHETDTTTVSTDTPAKVRCRDDHGQLRIEAAGQADRTTEAVLAADPQTMTALADRLYAIAAQAARGGPTDD